MVPSQSKNATIGQDALLLFRKDFDGIYAKRNATIYRSINASVSSGPNIGN